MGLDRDGEHGGQAGIDSQVTVPESSPSRLPGGALLDGHLLEGTATLTPHWLPSPPLGR